MKPCQATAMAVLRRRLRSGRRVLQALQLRGGHAGPVLEVRNPPKALGREKDQPEVGIYVDDSVRHNQNLVQKW